MKIWGFGAESRRFGGCLRHICGSWRPTSRGVKFRVVKETRRSLGLFQTCRDFYLPFSLSRWAFFLAAVRLLDSRKISRCLSHRVLPSWASSPHSTQSPRLLRFWYNIWL